MIIMMNTTEGTTTMKVSINSIQGMVRRYESAGDLAADGSQVLAERIGAQLGGIDEVIDFGSRYAGVVIVRIVSCEKHPDADKLNICMIDDGGVAGDVDRDAEGYVQVVCGAPNVRAGLTVAWLPPGSTVPESHDKEPFVLSARPLRGVVSQGMLASPRELVLGDSHDGILEIDGEITSGTAFDEHFGLKGDVIFDIENKMFTHRPDCFGFLGVARELAGVQAMPFRSPDWYVMDAAIHDVEAQPLPLTVRNELPELVPRFTAITMRDVQVGPSPVWLQIELAKVGLRPINNIVDLTNFFMLETGQPLHVYDYDKLRTLDEADEATIVVRHAQPGEKINLLNGKEIEPRAEAVMIASASRLIGVGGVMGGADTEVDDTTRNIVIECANFDMYSIRRTAMAHGLFTDAVTRFNKGQSPLQNRAVIARMVDDVRRLAAGKVASPLIDYLHISDEVLARGALHLPVHVSAGFINARLGLELAAESMRSLLTNVEFTVAVEGNDLTVSAPFWRTDIEIPEDVVEEVGRLYGYDRLPLVLPQRQLAPAARAPMLELKQRLRDSLSRAGANEILSYSFVHGKLLQTVGQDLEQAYGLSNALSPDLQYFRLSLTPSLLERVHANVKAGFGRFALFEIGKAHIKGQLDDAGLPQEYDRLALVVTADGKSAAEHAGAPYYQASHYLEQLLKPLGLAGAVTYGPLAADDSAVDSAYYAPGRSALVMHGDRMLGRIGEYSPAVRKSLKLPDFTAGFELDLQAVAAAHSPVHGYMALSRYPRVEQDICLRVTSSLPYAELYAFVLEELGRDTLEQTYYTLSPVDIYQRPDDTEHKQVTLRLSITSYAKTLRDSEVAALLDKLAAAAGQRYGATRI